MSEGSFVYCAYVDGAAIDPSWRVVKIGYTKSPIARFCVFQAVAWHGPARMVYAAVENGPVEEAWLHFLLRKYRIHHEWFHCPSEELMAAMEAFEEEFQTTFNRQIRDGEVEEIG